VRWWDALQVWIWCCRREVSIFILISSRLRSPIRPLKFLRPSRCDQEDSVRPVSQDISSKVHELITAPLSKYQGHYYDSGPDRDSKNKTPHLLPLDLEPLRVWDQVAGAGAVPPVPHYPVPLVPWYSRASCPVLLTCQRCQDSRRVSGDLTLQNKTRSVKLSDIKGGDSGWNPRDGVL
jgi:hypothetical protein